jgi:CubicO group peptidase (beta-lactamase class C family)
LLGPLGIDPVAIAQDTQGRDFIGCNWWMTPRKMARFGLLYQDARHGQANLWISQEWAATSTGGSSDYGRNWWTYMSVSGHKCFFAWGYLGQYVFVFPDLKIVVVITHDSSGSGNDSDDMSLFLKSYVAGALK